MSVICCPGELTSQNRRALLCSVWRKMYVVHYYVFWLDIPVNNPQRMNFINCLTDLLHDECNSGLRKGLGFFKLMIELSACPYFKDDIDVIVVMEATVHLNDVGMIKEHLNLHFSDELVSDFLFVQ